MIEWIETHMLSCQFKSITGFECWGCGFQRSCIALLQGDVSTSFSLFPALLPIMGVFISLGLHMKWPTQFSFGIVKGLLLVSFLLSIGNYIIKYTFNG